MARHASNDVPYAGMIQIRSKGHGCDPSLSPSIRTPSVVVQYITIIRRCQAAFCQYSNPYGSYTRLISTTLPASMRTVVLYWVKNSFSEDCMASTIPS